SLIDSGGIHGTQTDMSRLGRFDSLLPFLFRSLFRHLDVDFANFLDRQQALRNQPLRDDRFELVKENVDRVNLAASVASDQALAESVGKVVIDLTENSNVLARNLHTSGALWCRFGIGVNGRRARFCIVP